MAISLDPHTWNQLGLGLTQGEQRREEDECCDDFKKVASAHIYFKDKKKERKGMMMVQKATILKQTMTLRGKLW